MSRGSTWHICDFHLHTPYSVLNNQFGDPEKEETWKRYISEIERVATEKGIVAIGITDYFTIEGYKRVREYKKKGRLKNLLIFPNIEFRVDKIIYRTKNSTKGKRLNLHILFSPEIEPSLIEEHFLHDLNFVYDEHPFERPHTRKLKGSNLKSFGEDLRQQHEKFKEKSAIEIGMMNAVVSIQEIEKILKEDGRFNGQYLIVLAEEDLSLMDWDGQDHATRKQLLQLSHAVFSANPKTRDFLLGKSHSTPEQFLYEFKSLKPCIWGSDSHDFEQRFLEPDQERYCWIKSEVSWEGLKQILYEPEDRVRVQPDNPDPQKSVYTLDRFQVDSTKIHDTLTINRLDIPFNHNLVAIIGGRGSGKTALLDMIARCFPEGEKLEKLENSFYFRITSNSASPAIPVNLQFRSGTEFEKHVGQDSALFFAETDIVYLTQNHLDEYTSDPTKLNEHIIELVFGRDVDKKREFEQFEIDAQKLLNQIQSINLEIEQSQKEIAENLPEERQNLLQKEGELKDVEARLTEKVEQENERVNAAEQLTNQLKELKTQREKILTLRGLLKETEKDTLDFYNSYKIKVQDINTRTEALAIQLRLATLPVQIDTLESALSAIAQNIGALSKALPTLEDKIGNTQSKVNELEGITGEIARLQNERNDIVSEIEDIKAKIALLERKEERITKLNLDRNKLFDGVLRTVAAQRQFLQETIDIFEHNEEKTIEDISFSAIIDTSFSVRESYFQAISEKVDKRKHSHKDIVQSLSAIIEESEELFVSWQPEMLDTFLPVAQNLRNFRDSISLKASITESDFFNVLFSPFFRIGLQIKFNGRLLESLSMGERAVVLLKILLGLDDKPLLIDQPEEHLDNRYIYNELVPAFREAKTKRQIIIATHNANLVVNTDAEQIIVAEHDRGVISYDVGALETPRIREKIKTILEGGDQAFRKREEKYGYIF